MSVSVMGQFSDSDYIEYAGSYSVAVSTEILLCLYL